MKHKDTMNRYQACLDAGMTISQVSKELGKSRDYLMLWERRHGVRFNRNDEAVESLSPSQKEDYDTYIKERFGHDEAMRMIKSPKVKIRAVPKGMVTK